ncbi:MAG: site-specific integrase [Candidatus Sumerlaeota bacterium]|nr:site-specific integrase [Candidatus Sumerlaeota bacterium]
MANSFRKKVGFVTVWQDANEQFKARFQHPLTNQDVRRTLQVGAEEEAIQAALALNRAVLEDRGLLFLSAKPRKTVADMGPTIADALAESIRMTRGNEATRTRYQKGANLFQDWLRANQPSVQHWADLRPSMIIAWVQSMKATGKACDTMRLALTPIRRSSAYWAAERPDLFRDIVKGAGKQITLERPPMQPVTALAPEQVAQFLDWLKENAPRLWPMAYLSALSGLRMMEAASLRHCDIDWTAGTATIADTATHKPKNRGSYRTIPVMPEALAAVREHLDGSKVQGMREDPVFLHARGRPWNQSNLVTAWQRALKEAREDSGFAFLADFQPHRLRAAFSTMASRAKVDHRLLQRYVGHVPSDVLGMHYESITVEVLRKEIVDPVARYWATNKEAKEDADGRILAKTQ